MQNINPDDLRQAMRRWASGVSMVSSVLDGKLHGMTVSSFISVSLAPPLVVVSLERSTRTHRAVTQSGIFGITILSGRQQAISECFAGDGCDEDDRFAGLSTVTLATGAPFIAGGLAFMDCRVVSAQDVSTHTLFTGEVVALQTGEDGAPLIYYNRAYRRLVDDAYERR